MGSLLKVDDDWVDAGFCVLVFLAGRCGALRLDVAVDWVGVGSRAIIGGSVSRGRNHDVLLEPPVDEAGVAVAQSPGGSRPPQGTFHRSGQAVAGGRRGLVAGAPATGSG